MNEKLIISDADKAVCLGSGELRPCPFCGGDAVSAGMKNEVSGNHVYQIICTKFCGATIHVCCKEEEDARNKAVGRWNARVEDNAWRKVALATRVCSAAEDVSTPQKFEKAETNAACELVTSLQMLKGRHDAITTMIRRFLVAHRDTSKNWIEAFVEVGAITADFSYHPLYPFIKEVKQIK